MIFYSSLFNQKTSKKQIKKPTLQDIHFWYMYIYSTFAIHLNVGAVHTLDKRSPLLRA